MVHEVLHIIGFDSDLFDQFATNWADNDYYSRETPATIEEDADGDPVYRFEVKSPEVLKEARAHFGCDNLESVAFEQQGYYYGSAMAHWERRQFGNEMMTANSVANPVMSRITLAFLKDTGWYDVDYSKAETFTYGKDQGCSFITDPCYDD